MTKGYLIDDIVYDDGVNIFVYVKYSEMDFFKKTIIDLTSDNVFIEQIGEEYIHEEWEKIKIIGIIYVTGGYNSIEVIL